MPINALKLCTMKIKNILFSAAIPALILVGTLSVHAQQDPQFSQNMFNRQFPNPGYVGSSNAICGTLLARQQWVGFDGKPETYLLTAHMPLSMVTELPIGAGLSVYSDKLGQFSYLGFKVAGSYKFRVGEGNLGLGVSLGMVSVKLNDGWISNDPFTLDPTIPDAGISSSSFDADFGGYYEIKDKLYVGLSVLHLPSSTLQKNLSASDLFSYKVARHYYIMAGYQYNLQGIDLSLLPSTFIKTDGSSTQMDFNVIALYKNMFWAGASYRLQDAVAPMIGVQKTGIAKKGTLKVGYSYDVTTSTIKRYSNGSHEIMVGFCYDIEKIDKKEKKQDIRFLGR